MSATPQRSDGQATLFSFDKDIIYQYTLAEAIVDGELPIPIYIDCGIRYMNEILNSKEIIINEFEDRKEKDKLLKETNEFIRNINNYSNLPEIFGKYLNSNSKILYFCPPSNEKNRQEKTKEIYNVYNLRYQMFDTLDKNAHYYISFLEYSKSEDEEKSFLQDNSSVLKVLYTVNKYNEGIHPENINTLILGRGTNSVTLFYQQLGRALTAGRNHHIRPVVLDLVGNIHIYQELVNEVRKEINKRKSKNISTKEINRIENIYTTLKMNIYDEEIEQGKFLEYLKKNIQDNRTSKYCFDILKWIQELEEYCITFKEWPKSGDKKHKTKDGTTAYQLYSWLNNSGYIKDEFKYKDIKLDDGTFLRDKLDNLSKQYERLNMYGDIMKWYSNLEEYCITYKEWPKQGDKIHTTKAGITAYQLHHWLTRYIQNEFKYKDIKLDDGTFLRDKLDNLSKQYKRLNIYNSIMKWYSNLKEYCITFKEWPKQSDKIHATKDGTTTYQLYSWLKNSGYMQNEFKYRDIKLDDGTLLLDQIDSLHIIYTISSRSINELSNKDKNYNLTYAKKSKEVFLKLYYLCVMMKESYYNNDEDNFKLYLNNMKKIIEENKLGINIHELIKSFELNKKELEEYYYQLYTIYSIANMNEEAYFYKDMHNYVKIKRK